MDTVAKRITQAVEERFTPRSSTSTYDTSLQIVTFVLEELREDLLRLYRPNVPKGNFLGDAAQRGENRMLARVIYELGLSEDEIAAEFRLLDEEAWNQQEAAARRSDEKRERGE